MVEINDPAPSAKLWKTTSEGFDRDFDLKDAYADGITVLYFFPAAFTGVCTESNCQLRDDLGEFAELNAKLFGVSVDLPFSQQKFHELNNLNYPLLSDFNKTLIESFDIVDNDFAGFFKGVAKRSLFAVKDGKIIFKWVAESPGNYPPFDELKETIKAHV
ncbi:MAG: peroxiredoxin [Methanobacteriota archaeon]|nr:MAG: peroxiredoxin [Euryarchaeota archaeon]